MHVHRPKHVLDQLQISASALRLWSEKFGPVLSPSAQKSTTETGGAAQRRYTDEDLSTLLRAKAYLKSGKTYEETLELLQSGEDIVFDDVPEPAESPRTNELATTGSLDDHPVFVAFREALAAKDETIRAKDQLIETLQLQLARQDSTPQTLQLRFRWQFLERLLTAEQ